MGEHGGNRLPLELRSLVNQPRSTSHMICTVSSLVDAFQGSLSLRLCRAFPTNTILIRITLNEAVYRVLVNNHGSQRQAVLPCLECRKAPIRLAFSNMSTGNDNSSSSSSSMYL